MPGEESTAEPARERPRGLAGAFLEQAVDALGATGDPDRLYPRRVRRDPAPREDRYGLAELDAVNQRRTHARTAVLFAALAAEAYVNEFLATKLPAKDFEAMDRLPTVEKYVVGCRLAVGESLFERGREPVQTIAALFKLRDKLVHPKAGYGPPTSMLDAAREPEETFTPRNAGHFIVQVAAAAGTLVRSAHPGTPDVPADIITLTRETLIRYADRASTVLPSIAAPAQDPLLHQLIRSFGSRSKPAN